MENGYLANTILLMILSFVGIWIGSGLIIRSVDKLATKLKASSFLVSFFVLGFLTQTAEIGVAINSYIDQTLEVSVGNLLGGIIVLFLLFVPLLAIAGNGIKLDRKLNKSVLLLVIIALTLPSFFFLDNHLQFRESIVLIGGYFLIGLLILLTMSNKTLKKTPLKKVKQNFLYLVLIVVGVVILFISCDLLVNEINAVALELGITPFIISLLGLSIGTNLPEISLSIKSILQGKKEIAFGNYIGAATFNLFILGVLGLMNNRITVQGDFLKIALFTFTGLILFYIFILSKNNLSRKEGLIILLVYLMFIGSHFINF